MNDKSQDRMVCFLFGAVLFIAIWLAIISGMVIAVCEDVLALTSAESETTPETEVVINPTESTTAPVETSIPEPEETIHIEPTETVSEATEPPVMEETVPAVNPDELEILACVIYQEAGGDTHCDDCRRRVADVVLNRVADPRFPNTMYEVLTAENQYGLFHWTGIVWPDRAKNPYEANAVERAYRIAKEVLMGQHSDLYGKGYIWQAGFIQGVDNIYHCGHYFGK